jgi:molybdopterin synthase catalytic subunit
MIKIQRGPISVDELLTLVRRPDSGATALFLGTVRNHSRGHTIVRLEYEAYESMAEKELARVEREVIDRWPVLGTAFVHRLGAMEIGEVSVAIVVSTAHRKDAFEACRYAIDRIKQVVPIWKTETTQDGTFIIEGKEARRG